MRTAPRKAKTHTSSTDPGRGLDTTDGSPKAPLVRRSVIAASVVSLLVAGGVGWLSAAVAPESAAAAQALTTANAAPTTVRMASPTTVTPIGVAAVSQPATAPTTAAAHTPATSLAPRPAPVAVSSPAPSGCAAALAYLASHSAPGFTFQCPGYALGHQAMTCVNVAGVCPGLKEIVIARACPASWMNEASNSWVLTGQSNRMIDPYGYCT